MKYEPIFTNSRRTFFHSHVLTENKTSSKHQNFPFFHTSSLAIYVPRLDLLKYVLNVLTNWVKW